MTTQWIIDVMEEWAPTKWAVASDNVGLLIGDRARQLKRVLTALDVTENVLREAVQGRFDVIVSHHPLISRHVQPINQITADSTLGKKIMTLIGNGISLYCAHTNLDAAPGGVNDLLFDIFGLTNKEMLVDYTETPSMGQIGYLPQPLKLSELASHICKVLSLESIRYAGDFDKMIHKVGFAGGNGTASVNDALEKKCDVYITGDVGHHLAIDVIEAGMAIIDGTHFSTEVPVAQAIANRLTKAAEAQGYSIVVEQSKSESKVFKTTYGD